MSKDISGSSENSPIENRWLLEEAKAAASNPNLADEVNRRHNTYSELGKSLIEGIAVRGPDNFLENLRMQIEFYNEYSSGSSGELLATIAAETGVDFGDMIDPRTNLHKLFSGYFKKVGK